MGKRCPTETGIYNPGQKRGSGEYRKSKKQKDRDDFKEDRAGKKRINRRGKGHKCTLHLQKGKNKLPNRSQIYIAKISPA